MTEPFAAWLDLHTSSTWNWYVKRLSGNDTLATGAHQAGPYFPKSVIFALFPSLDRPAATNPEIVISAAVDSPSGGQHDIRAVWYNQETRDECRVTRWGGKGSVILDPESTGSVAVFAFHQVAGQDADECRVWLCELPEENLLEERVGPIEPGTPLFLLGGNSTAHRTPARGVLSPCRLTLDTMPQAWRETFPSGADIASRSVVLRPMAGRSTDERLLSRRDCEYEMFRSVEELHVLPRIEKGFPSVDEFIALSNAVNNRRKARSGHSLELQLAAIFEEEQVQFSHGEISEGNKRPDFLFPSATAYRAGQAPVWMLAAKTTCKDRWRQVLNEADGIREKHLITLQEGISSNQYAEMRAAHVRLVVPQPLQNSYPKDVRPELVTLEQFLELVSTGR